MAMTPCCEKPEGCHRKRLLGFKRDVCESSDRNYAISPDVVCVTCDQPTWSGEYSIRSTCFTASSNFTGRLN